MSNHQNTHRFNTNGAESPNGSDQGPSNRIRNGGNRKGKTKEPHYQHNPEDTGEVRSTRDMHEMIRISDSTRRCLAEADAMYEQLSEDILEAVENRKRVTELSEQCKQKDIEIDEQQIAINRIMIQSGNKDKKLEKREQEILEAEKAMEKKKADVDKFKAREELKVEEAKLKLSQTHEALLKKDKASLEREFKEYKEKFEKEVKQRDEEKKKKVADLQTENKRLLDEVKGLKTKTDDCNQKLKNANSRYEDMESLRRLSKEEAAKSQDELQKIKAEFGLESNTPQFFQEQFGGLSNQVHTISTKFGKDLNPKDWSLLHDELKALDDSLAAVPISGSQESKLLRIAHAARIISLNLSSIILKPFSSDNTFQPDRQNAVNLLEEAVLGLEKSGESNRAAVVFKSLAIRGFQTLGPLRTASSTCITRTEAFIQTVKPILSLLVPETQYTSLEESLRSLAESAISIWKSAQGDELMEIKASLDLDPNLQMDWHSPFFDAGNDPLDTAIVASNNPNIFTLFPRITARISSPPIDLRLKVPGSFDDSKIGTQVQEICIHPGIGLSNSSSLVQRAIEEQHDMEQRLRAERLMMEVEAAQKLLSDMNKTKLQRSGSIVGSPSPTAEWSMVGGQKKAPEE